MAHVGGYHGGEDRAAEGEDCVDWEEDGLLQWIPEIGDCAACAGEWWAAEEAGEEAEYNLRSDVGTDAAGHGEDHEEYQGADVDNVTADDL